MPDNKLKDAMKAEGKPPSFILNNSADKCAGNFADVSSKQAEDAAENCRALSCDEKPLISVIIPVYNTEEYIERTLRSVTGNTYKNLEIICVDDGSTDKSPDILSCMQNEDERVLIISRDNGGASAARNTGLSKARGEWVAFLDSDDFIHPLYFETLFEIQRRTGADIAVCGRKTFVNGKTAKETPEDFADAFEDGENIVPYDLSAVILDIDGVYKNRYVKESCYGRIYRYELIASRRFPEGVNFGEDIIFNQALYLGNENLRLAYSSRELYAYCRRPSSITATLPVSAFCPLADWCYEHAALCTGVMKKYLLSDAFKIYLTIRYFEMYNEDRKMSDHCELKLASCAGMLKQVRGIPLAKRAAFSLFRRFPFLYRIFRIALDPSLISWEKKQKARV